MEQVFLGFAFCLGMIVWLIIGVTLGFTMKRDAEVKDFSAKWWGGFVFTFVGGWVVLLVVAIALRISRFVSSTLEA
jgi:hypothetical protein